MFIQPNINIETPSFDAFYLFIIGYIVFFISGWLLSMPIRYLMYLACKKHGLMKQELMPWLTDWAKLLLTNLIIYVPYLSLFTLIFYYNFNSGTIILLVLATLFVLLLIGTKFLQKIVSMWFIHGLYLLKSGNVLNFWNKLAKENNIKTYPLWILPISAKVKYNNAFAFGFKNFGCILMTDCLLNNLPQEQVAAILAHESAHLNKNDILIRLLCIAILALCIYFVCEYLFQTDIYLGLVIYLILLLGSFPLIFYLARRQEYCADKFSFDLLGDPAPMIEALNYLYTENKYPISSKKSLWLKFFSIHPSFEDRKTKLNSYKK